ncbi:MAG: endonuclease/exonuclease/phosphatase family protein [Phycisphaerales bacterium]
MSFFPSLQSLRLRLTAALATLLCAHAATASPVAIRVATFNIEDLRTEELLHPYSERARRAAAVIQAIRPNVILINEITYDEPSAPGFPPDGEPGQNATRFAKLLAEPQADGLRGLTMNAFSAPSNTGRASGFDLDRNGEVVTLVPQQPEPNRDGSPVAQTAAGRAYGGDAWGFGTFPGQYGMALLVDNRLELLRDNARTFRLFPWSFMPENLMPTVPNTSADQEGEPEPWYAGDAGDLFRLSSKSHWDVPIRLPNGSILHLLCSHPTPPAFDGDEQRNKRRNHDEIRFWSDYIDNAAYIVDDAGQPGGLGANRHFIIAGDLNADPDEGSSIANPIGRLLLASRWVSSVPAPVSDIEIDGLDADDTALFGLPVDYVLPSRTLDVRRSGVWRPKPGPDGTADIFPSDHFPVWIDVVVPPPGG